VEWDLNKPLIDGNARHFIALKLRCNQADVGRTGLNGKVNFTAAHHVASNIAAKNTQDLDCSAWQR